MEPWDKDFCGDEYPEVKQQFSRYNQPPGPFEIIPCISLWQPWAQWISLGWKTIETRLHTRFKSLVGKRIGIHAAVRWDSAALDLANAYLTDDQVAQTKSFIRAGGAVICTASVSSFRELTLLDSSAALIDCRTTRRYGLFLQEVEGIEMVPCKGMQGIFYARVRVGGGNLI